MTKFSASMARAAAIATLVSGVMLAGTTFAAPSDSTMPVEPPNSTVNLDSHGDMTGSSPDTSSTTTPDSTAAMAPSSSQGSMQMQHKHWDHKEGAMKAESPDQMKAHLEAHIKMLHDKLMITQDQESAWGGVADAMRNSENKTAQLIQERKENKGTMTAVDDMQSYQQIVQAHADGFNQVIAAFKPLYSSMSDAQKANADKVFQEVGAPHHGMHHHKHAANAAAPTTK